jgi:type III restriction enzyme
MDSFFERPILNSPYAYPAQHWELDEDGQPTNRIVDSRRRSELITPVPKPQRRRRAPNQAGFVFDSGEGLSTEEQEYNPTPIINEIRGYVNDWRRLPNPDQWQVSPETARLLQHWRHHPFQDIRPFFCQVEAVETVIWLTEVAPKRGAAVAKFGAHLRAANEQSNPDLLRIALKMATGSGKTSVMAMLIAWQTVNAVRHPGSRQFSRAFLVVTPGITIKDRLTVLRELRSVRARARAREPGYSPIDTVTPDLCNSRLRPGATSNRHARCEARPDSRVEWREQSTRNSRKPP